MLEEELRPLIKKKRFWTDYFWITEADHHGGWPILKRGSARFWFGDCIIEVGLDPHFSYLPLSFETENLAWGSQLGHDDQAHWMPYSLRWEELELICQAIAAEDPEDRLLQHPGAPLLFLYRFAPICVSDDADRIVALLARAFRRLRKGLFTDEDIQTFIEKSDRRKANLYWHYDSERDYWWIGTGEDPKSADGAYTIRGQWHEKLRFDYEEWNVLLKEARRVINGEPKIESEESEDDGTEEDGDDVMEDKATAEEGKDTQNKDEHPETVESGGQKSNEDGESMDVDGNEPDTETGEQVTGRSEEGSENQDNEDDKEEEDEDDNDDEDEDSDDEDDPESKMEEEEYHTDSGEDDSLITDTELAVRYRMRERHYLELVLEYRADDRPLSTLSGRYYYLALDSTLRILSLGSSQSSGASSSTINGKYVSKSDYISVKVFDDLARGRAITKSYLWWLCAPLQTRLLGEKKPPLDLADTAADTSEEEYMAICKPEFLPSCSWLVSPTIPNGCAATLASKEVLHGHDDDGKGKESEDKTEPKSSQGTSRVNLIQGPTADSWFTVKTSDGGELGFSFKRQDEDDVDGAGLVAVRKLTPEVVGILYRFMLKAEMVLMPMALTLKPLESEIQENWVPHEVVPSADTLYEILKKGAYQRWVDAEVKKPEAQEQSVS